MNLFLTEYSFDSCENWLLPSARNLLVLRFIKEEAWELRAIELLHCLFTPWCIHIQWRTKNSGSSGAKCMERWSHGLEAVRKQGRWHMRPSANPSSRVGCGMMRGNPNWIMGSLSSCPKSHPPTIRIGGRFLLVLSEIYLTSKSELDMGLRENLSGLQFKVNPSWTWAFGLKSEWACVPRVLGRTNWFRFVSFCIESKPNRSKRVCFLYSTEHQLYSALGLFCARVLVVTIKAEPCAPM